MMVAGRKIDAVAIVFILAAVKLPLLRGNESSNK
jgi:hypothetical protein